MKNCRIRCTEQRHLRTTHYDSGDVGQAKWPFGLSHNRHGLAGAGWARNQNINNLPIATAMAGVNMRLSPNAYRELHWHKQGEWALM